jgi:hypothetical protein
MRDTPIPNFRRRFRALVPATSLLLIGAFVLYGFLDQRWWMAGYLPVLVIVCITAAWRQTSVRCPHCDRLVYEQEHTDVGKTVVFLCRPCDARLVTDVPFPVPG